MFEGPLQKIRPSGSGFSVNLSIGRLLPEIEEHLTDPSSGWEIAVPSIFSTPSFVPPYGWPHPVADFIERPPSLSSPEAPREAVDLLRTAYESLDADQLFYINPGYHNILLDPQRSFEGLLVRRKVPEMFHFTFNPRSSLPRLAAALINNTLGSVLSRERWFLFTFPLVPAYFPHPLLWDGRTHVGHLHVLQPGTYVPRKSAVEIEIFKVPRGTTVVYGAEGEELEVKGERGSPVAIYDVLERVEPEKGFRLDAGNYLFVIKNKSAKPVEIYLVYPFLGRSHIIEPADTVAFLTHLPYNTRFEDITDLVRVLALKEDSVIHPHEVREPIGWNKRKGQFIFAVNVVEAFTLPEKYVGVVTELSKGFMDKKTGELFSWREAVTTPILDRVKTGKAFSEPLFVLVDIGEIPEGVITHWTNASFANTGIFDPGFKGKEIVGEKKTHLAFVTLTPFPGLKVKIEEGAYFPQVARRYRGSVTYSGGW